MIDLTGKHIFIAGGSRGIGAETACMAARDGAAVSINYARSAWSPTSRRQAGKRSPWQAMCRKRGAGSGDGEGASLQDMTVEFWDRTMAVNVRGTFLAERAEYFAYATSKGAQILFMHSMAKELAGDQIRVNCIAPAWTETEMAAPSLDVLGREDVAKNCPLGRIGLPHLSAGATRFCSATSLPSSRAARAP